MDPGSRIVFRSDKSIKLTIKELQVGTGTLRSNRLEKKSLLKSVLSKNKMERGYLDAITGICDESKVHVTRWKDHHAVVTLASTLVRQHPIGKKYTLAKQLKNIFM
ncbi:unnamed protein product [Lepeophtheirus salmonis]|uniref:(salmon louse) hypothetical protein n=1 Tax=Lepeophtheirus salmonis TaxID=72036 RepID=A0A7R8D3Q7_LEPSM|nr:unnamed protein product [Lepeophtheirus salmonis]CAF3019198.1 unnamed protein product [Lepeophtheirus salmonis]